MRKFYVLELQNNEVFSSENVLRELVEHLNTALAVLLTEVIQTDNPKELQVGFIFLKFISNDEYFLEYIKLNRTIITSL